MTIHSKIIDTSETATKHVGKHLGKFLACLIGTTAVCLAAYTVVVESLVQTSAIPATYKWFLLENVPSPRVIFESGSNSHHAIDTDTLGEALGMTAINIADNGGFALEDKITRLETYTRPGDVVVLPLEWTFYHREKLTDNYVETLFNINRDYYRSMPVTKRVQRALSLPPEKVITEISNHRSNTNSDIESPAKELFVSALTQSTGHQSKEKSSGPGAGVAEQSCDDYVLGKEPQRQNLMLGKNIKPALRRLQRLKSRGVDIHFAWPALAGEGCLTASAYVKGFRQEIETTVNKAGFEFLGTPSQSLYGQAFRDDTPYHIIKEATDVHTQKMINFLTAKGYSSDGAPLDIKTFARHRLLELELAQTPEVRQTALPLNQTLSMDGPELRNHIEFTAGWWASEPYGRWMRDNRAMFSLTLPDVLPANTLLEIKGITKSGRPELVDVSLNGQLITSGLFGDIPLLIPLDGLPRGETLSIFIELPEASTPQSPLELGESEDARSLTLLFQTMELITPEASIPPVSIAVTETAASVPAATRTKYLPTPSLTSFTSMATLQSCLPGSDVIRQSSLPIAYGQGWWAQETLGRWMKGQEADFGLKLPEANKISGQSSKPVRYTLKLTGDFFLGKPQAVDVFVNGNFTEIDSVTTNGVITASFLKTTAETDVQVSVKLAKPNSQSPQQLGLSQDDRTLTYFLKSIELSPT